MTGFKLTKRRVAGIAAILSICLMLLGALSDLFIFAAGDSTTSPVAPFNLDVASLRIADAYFVPGLSPEQRLESAVSTFSEIAPMTSWGIPLPSVQSMRTKLAGNITPGRLWQSRPVGDCVISGCPCTKDPPCFQRCTRPGSCENVLTGRPQASEITALEVTFWDSLLNRNQPAPRGRLVSYPLRYQIVIPLIQLCFGQTAPSSFQSPIQGLEQLDEIRRRVHSEFSGVAGPFDHTEELVFGDHQELRDTLTSLKEQISGVSAETTLVFVVFENTTCERSSSRDGGESPRVSFVSARAQNSSGLTLFNPEEVTALITTELGVNRVEFSVVLASSVQHSAHRIFYPSVSNPGRCMDEIERSERNYPIMRGPDDHPDRWRGTMALIRRTQLMMGGFVPYLPSCDATLLSTVPDLNRDGIRDFHDFCAYPSANQMQLPSRIRLGMESSTQGFAVVPSSFISAGVADADGRIFCDPTGSYGSRLNELAGRYQRPRRTVVARW